MIVSDAAERWTVVHNTESEPEGGPSVRRYPVPGGWLYQVEKDEYFDNTKDGTAYHPPVFVPEPQPVVAKPTSRVELANAERAKWGGDET